MAVHQIDWSARLDVTAELICGLKPKRVLEIGASEFSFRQLYSGADVWETLDSQGEATHVADINVQNLHLALPDSRYDAVICTEVIEHMLWPQALLREIARILDKPNGHLIVSVPNIVSLSYRLAWMLGRLPSCAASANLPPVLGSTTYVGDSGELNGGHVVDFNKDRLLKLLQITGYSVELLTGCGLFWHRQVLPRWALPASLSSNLIAVARPR